MYNSGVGTWEAIANSRKEMAKEMIAKPEERAERLAKMVPRPAAPATCQKNKGTADCTVKTIDCNS